MFKSWNELNLKVYLATAMTGRTKSELVTQALSDVQLAKQYGIDAISPVLSEGVDGKSDDKLIAGYDFLKEKWAEDKQLIRECHIVIDTTGDMKSEGVTHEIGYARYCLWKPVIRIKAFNPNASVDKLEDDTVVASIHLAYILALKNWGTRRKRIAWRIKMLIRCLPKWLYYQYKELTHS